MTGKANTSYEAALQRGMRELAGAQRDLGLAIPNQMTRGRRVRHGRRAAAAVAAGVLAVSAVNGCAVQVASPTAVTVSPAVSHQTAEVLPPLALKPRAEDHTNRGSLPLPQPAHPSVGTSYPYNWYAHCGMVYITFDGKVWKVDHPVAVPEMHPDAKGITWGPPIVPGYVTLMSAAELRFDAPTYITAVPLHVTTDSVPTCS